MRNKDQYIQSQYRPELDGLKAFAVLTVIINHFNKNSAKWIPFGIYFLLYQDF